MSEQPGQRRSPCPVDMRERAVGLVFETERHCETGCEAIRSVAVKLGPNPETIRLWVRRAEIDAGQRGGLTTDGRINPRMRYCCPCSERYSARADV